MATVNDGDVWRPLRALTAAPVLAERVAFTRDFLSQMSGTLVEQRVAASTMSLGLFARLISPYLGATVLDVRLPAPDLDQLFWQPAAGGPWPLALSGSRQRPEIRQLITDVVLPLAGAIADQYSLSQQTLRGNAASALFGAVTMIGTERADLHGKSWHVATTLLADVLPGSGRLDGRFIRESCCLYYRIPGGGYCGDCILANS